MGTGQTFAPDAAAIERLAEAAIARLPALFRRHLTNVVLRIEDFADDAVLNQLGIEDPFELSGLYTGRPVSEPTARGPYCGSLGYVGFDGTMDTSILIRTCTVGKGWVQLEFAHPERIRRVVWSRDRGSDGRVYSDRLATGYRIEVSSQVGVGSTFIVALKPGGFLTRDPRAVERKKYGRPKARRSFQFSKR